MIRVGVKNGCPEALPPAETQKELQTNKEKVNNFKVIA